MKPLMILCLVFFFSLLASPLLAQNAVPNRDCSGSDHGGPPHEKENYDGQAGKECHGTSNAGNTGVGDDGKCANPPQNGGQKADVWCKQPTFGRSACTAFLFCAPNTTPDSCGGPDWEAFAGVNAAGKAYIYCHNLKTGAVVNDKICH